MNEDTKNRLSRLFNGKTGRSVTIPLDHGFYLGNAPGLEDPCRVLEEILDEGVDATLMSFGIGKITRDLFDGENAPGRILSADCVMLTNVPGEHHGFFDFDLFIEIEQALRWGFHAVKVLLIWGLDYEYQMNEIRAVAELARQCDRWNMPLMIEPVLWGRHIPPDRKDDPDTIAHAARIALEMGADILKVPYTGSVDHFKSLVERTPIPVVVLGGTDMRDTRHVLQTARDSVDAGGKGVVFGRVVWQSGQMKGLIRGLKDVVHDLAGVDEVMERHDLT
jgi:class I fructose-bisphosphate aldolase